MTIAFTFSDASISADGYVPAIIILTDENGNILTDENGNIWVIYA